MPRQDERKRPEEVRPEVSRVTLKEQKDVQTVEYNHKGYIPRWFNDDDSNRIMKAQSRGWKPVTDEVLVGDVGAKNQNQTLGSGARKQVSVDKRTGEPLYAILMEIKEEYYNEDFEYKQSIEDKKMEALTESLDKGELAYSK